MENFFEQNDPYMEEHSHKEHEVVEPEFVEPQEPFRDSLEERVDAELEQAGDGVDRSEAEEPFKDPIFEELNRESAEQANEFVVPNFESGVEGSVERIGELEGLTDSEVEQIKGDGVEAATEAKSVIEAEKKAENIVIKTGDKEYLGDAPNTYLGETGYENRPDGVYDSSFPNSEIEKRIIEDAEKQDKTYEKREEGEKAHMLNPPWRTSGRGPREYRRPSSPEQTQRRVMNKDYKTKAKYKR
jgi:hypothetical protein